MTNKFQQFGNMQRGNPAVEQFLGSLMKGIIPKGIASQKQMGMGGFGSLGKLRMGHGFNRTQRFGNRANLKNFLMQYSNQGKRNIKTMDLNRLTKF
jgi:hypothetical protein